MDRKFLTIVLFLILDLAAINASPQYKIGVGRADCTGPAVEIGFMGYGKVNQRGSGIHLRQFSRAFIVSDGLKRVVFVSVDAAMMGHAVKRDVVERLQKNYGDIYNMDNVAISGTHTHSAPGGFLMHLIYDISILGFVSQTFAALVDGIYMSIVRAHQNLDFGQLYIGTTTILDANVNRSPTSYMENPQEERAQYEYDVDKTLTQIRFISETNGLIGAINWFAVHPTSMNNTNGLISSDNMGYASILLEKEMNPKDLPGKGRFVGAFASSNLGDVSPNIMGPKCQKTGISCDIYTSSCPKDHGECVASGPGKDIFESTKIIATRIYKGASNLLRSSDIREITGSIDSIHQFVDMPNYKTIAYNPLTKNTEEITGCVPALGTSFAAGTTDGPGMFDFKQGKDDSNPLWKLVFSCIVPPLPEDHTCHAPKPILIATGRAKGNLEWQPKIVPTQILKVGDVLLTPVPGELTTMAGRRLKNQVRKEALESSGEEYEVIIAGLSNIYSSYVTTPEEYQAQRYEAASTIFGPQTLTIYIDQYQKLTKALVKKVKIEPGPTPPRLDSHTLSLVPGVMWDAHFIGYDFGDCKKQPRDVYHIGDRVRATFVAGNPRNNLHTESTYLAVEKQEKDGNWTVVLTDANWETRFYWEQVFVLGMSEAHVTWQISRDTEPGTYRIKHFGHYRFIFSGIFPYQGVTRAFTVRA